MIILYTLRNNWLVYELLVTIQATDLLSEITIACLSQHNNQLVTHKPADLSTDQEVL